MSHIGKLWKALEKDEREEWEAKAAPGREEYKFGDLTRATWEKADKGLKDAGEQLKEGVLPPRQQHRQGASTCTHTCA